MKKIVTILLFLTISLSLQAQKNPYRFGLKIGTPNLAGLGLEYMPIENLGANLDFSYFSLDIDDQSTASYTYFSIGGTYYLSKEGEGLYGGLLFGRMSFGIEQTDQIGQFGQTGGSSEFSVGFTMVGIKAGYRWNFGVFSIAPEIGYALGSMDDEVEYSITFPDGSSENDVYDTSDIPSLSGIMASFSLGFAF